MKSSLTLFDAVSARGTVFEQALDRFFGGTRDGRTVLVPPSYMSMNSNCRGVLVFVDGAEMTVMSDDINQLVSLSEVEAVESYSGVGTIPPQFNSTGSACGVVVIWRRGAG